MICQSSNSSSTAPNLMIRFFKASHTAESILAGIELHHMFQKHQYCHSTDMAIFEYF